jgi:glycosyltransferase involved in cell wall biosynthesis
MQTEPQGEIAYILKGFPRLSETFIANEIHLLEELGLKLRIFSIKKGELDKTHAVISKIQAPLVYLPETTSLTENNFLLWLLRNLPLFAVEHAKLALRNPWAYIKTLTEAIRMGFRYRGNRSGAFKKVFIKEFLQAGYIASHVLRHGGIRHLHGHFCHGATTITWFTSQLTGIPFSFTAHAKDIYEDRQNPGDLLPRKLKTARFVATCTAANQHHLEALCPDVPTIHTIYHGLNTDYFQPKNTINNTTVTPLVLSVGRFVEKKGFHYLIEACAQLKQAGIPFRCLILGEDGDQSETIRHQITKLALENNVELQGPVTQEQLREIYRSATLFVLPCLITNSGDRDGIPNVMVEAMSMGLPVVSTNISGVPELVKHGINGLLVPERDSTALAGALQCILENAGLRQHFGTRARDTVCQTFDARKTTLSLKDLLLNAAQDSGLPA